MPDLTLQHIDQIANDISSQEIIFSHLLHDLVDHVCCDVEYEMQNGLPFNEAYKKVRKKMGSHRRLKEIQEETLYAVDTKYRKMKKTMKISGIIGTVLLGLAAMFKIQHWPMAGAMLTLGAFTLAFVFVPSALGVLWKETHNRKRIFLFISAFFAGLFFIAGTLFKVQHWPGSGLVLTLASLFGIVFFIPALLANRLANMEDKSKKPVYIIGAIGAVFFLAGMLFKIMHWPLATGFMLVGMILLSIIVFPWYTWLTWKDEDYISSKFIFMVTGLLLIVLPGALISLNLQHNFESGFYHHNERQQRVFDFKSDQNRLILDRYKDSLVYSQMEKIHSETGKLVSLITDIQIKMVQQAEGGPDNPALARDQYGQTDHGPEIIYTKLPDPFTRQPAREYLISGCEARKNLEAEIVKYSQFISELQNGDNQLFSGPLEASGNLADLLPGKNKVSLMSALHALELMKNTLLFIESDLLCTISSNY